MSRLVFTAPANLLLLGEYAVLEEGGLGLAAAAGPRVRVEAAREGPAGTAAPQRGAPPGEAPLEVSGAWGGGSFLWRPGRDSAAAPLVEAVARCVSERLGRLPGGLVRTDSSAFYDGGRKRGYGSSAAVAVALSRAFLALAGVEDPGTALEVALEAHRRSQGGEGSGYDVLASFHGGLGLFTGGRRPSWKALRLPWLGPLVVLPGEGSVSTREAIAGYRAWCLGRPGEARRFLAASNRAVEGFAGAATRGLARACFARGRRLGLRLGGAIGVDASFRRRLLPAGFRSADCKSLGAGNELGWLFPEQPSVPEGCPVLTVEAEGLRCEP